VGEHFAAGYMACPDEPPALRFARGVAAWLSRCELPPYGGEPLYPCGPALWWRGAAVEWHYSACMTYSPERLQQKLDAATDNVTREALQAVEAGQRDHPRVGGYTHSIPNYRRILAEGLDSYLPRIERSRQIGERRGEQERVEFCRAMAIIWEGIRAFHRRAVELIESAECGDPDEEANRERLLAALRRVPWQPAQSFYEALVAVNFILYMDGPDDLGRFDQDLGPFYDQDLAAGLIAHDEAVALVARVWDNINACGAWNVALGGLLESGETAINAFTHVCVEAGRGKRRPNLALRLHRHAPETIWDAALDCIETGCGLPALYHEELYLQGIREAHLGVSEADLPDFAFGGCTELMVHGKSNVGSLEGDLNLPLVLVRTLKEHLTRCQGFEDLAARYEEDLRCEIRSLTDQWNANQERKARYQPQVMRSLLIDDCLDNGREYNAGGARYNWCVVNVMGLANVVDSLAAVRDAVWESGDVTAAQLAAALTADFEGHETLRQRLMRCPRFGNGDDATDDLAERVSTYVFQELRRYAPWRGGRYIPACLMFVTYAHFGSFVGATPDGRRAGEPIADSAGAMQGRDRAGPTALFRSVGRIKHWLAPGTLVVNVRFSPRFFRDEQTRRKLKELVRTYFDLGGMQLQINVVDQDTLRAAYEHPEQYGDLIIRVGGYSEYWAHLDDALRLSILERTEHE
jgi:formate C-acetyltransferase